VPVGFTRSNYPVDIKKLFLTFLQDLFAQHKQFKWDINPAVSKILIIDKHTVDLSTLEKRPTVVLSRGPFGWSYIGTGQSLKSSFLKGDGRDTYTDLLSGSLTLNCMARAGIFAETLANHIFIHLTGGKRWLRQAGVHSVTNVSVGEEQILKSDSSIELSVVPVTLQYQVQKTIRTGEQYYSIYLSDYGKSYPKESYYYQGVDFDVDTTLSGVDFFLPPPSGTGFVATYTATNDAGAIWEVSEGVINGLSDGINKHYTVPNKIYGAPLLSDIVGSGYSADGHIIESELTTSGIHYDM